MRYVIFKNGLFQMILNFYYKDELEAMLKLVNFAEDAVYTAKMVDDDVSNDEYVREWT